MTTTNDTHPTGLPQMPGVRPPQCPFDPPSEYADWRESSGLQRVITGDGTLAWAISRYEDARAVLGDDRFSADVLDGIGADAFPRMDDPEHARLRRMLTGDFTVKRVAAMRPEIENTTNEIIDAMISQGQSADLVRDFALPLPSLVISLLLGVPYEDHPMFQEQSKVTIRLDSSEEEKRDAGEALFRYLYQLVLRKQDQPGEDLISRLLADQVSKGDLDIQQVAMMGITLLVAGHETTGNMIGLSVLTLLEHPDIAAVIRDTDDETTVASAVEELLRYLSIVQAGVIRVATDDATVGGQLIRKWDQVTVNVPAANRDTALTDNPDQLDTTRQLRTHLAFGFGIHQCLGQHLARLELQIALPTLLRRLPGLRLAIPLEELKRRDNMAVYGLNELPVTW